MTGLFRGRGMAKRTSGKKKLEETQRERERERQRQREKGKNCTEEKRRVRTRI